MEKLQGNVQKPNSNEKQINGSNEEKRESR